MSREPVSDDDNELLDLAATVADGKAIDWAELESAARTDRERRLVRQLRFVAGVAAASGDAHVLTRLSASSARSAAAVRHGRAAERAGGPGSGAHSHDTGPRETWGRFELDGELGRGTLGTVFRAWDPQLERYVAVKLLRAERRDAPEWRGRVLDEGRLLARVQHRNLVNVFEAVDHDDIPGLCMELVEGRTLEDRVERDGVLSAGEAIVTGEEVCLALAALHREGLLHRDVKARNVVREDGGRYVLMDLGAGHATSTADPGQGTPLYSAPEVLAGGAATVRSDVYSVGVLLYYLVTGEFPVEAESIDDLRDAHRAGRYVSLLERRPDLPVPFASVVERALEPDPGRRYDTAIGLRQALAGANGAIAVLTSGGSPVPIAAPQPARGWTSHGVPWTRPAAAAGLIAATVTIVVALGAALWKPLVDAGSAAEPIRLAVLPLENLGPDPDYLAAGLTVELIRQLGRNPGFRVISDTASSRTELRGRSTAEVAQALGVGYVLRGALTREEDGRAVALRLVTPDDRQEWDGRFQAASLGGSVRLASTAARHLGSALSPDTEPAAEAVEPLSPDAAEQWVLAGRLMASREPADLQRAHQLLLDLVEAEPAFARAHAALAASYRQLQLAALLLPADAYRQGIEAARRALALDPDLQEAHVAVADLQFYYAWDWDGAAEEYRRACELNRSDDWALTQFSRLLAAAGEVESALEMARDSRTLMPRSVEAEGTYGIALYYAREYEKAAEVLQAALGMNGGERATMRLALGRTLTELGDQQAALTELERAVAESGGVPVYVAELARVHAVAGNGADARRLLSTLEGQLARGEALLDAQHFAYVYAALGDADRAFDYLDAAVQDQSAGVLWARVDPRLDALRGDPRFGRFIERIGGLSPSVAARVAG